MAFLQSSGAISINDIKTLFGGPASPSLANYYRGGSYIPASKTVVTREPSSGEYWQAAGSFYYWAVNKGTYQNTGGWAGGTPFSGVGNSSTTSYTTGGYTYFRGTYKTTSTPYTGYGSDYYAIYRTSSSTVSINTGIPSSGQISLSQFYGAEKP